MDSDASATHPAAMDATWLFISGLFSLLGMAVFVYGRRQRTATHTLIGVLLMVYPYFVSSMLALIGIGGLLVVGLVIGGRLEGD
jgi:hypothetical protein